MADPRFAGSGVALVTPFDADGVNVYRGEGKALGRHDGPLVLTARD
jgi:dihydrodipicolinate synthase/N-acetylneuraminate lyase